MATVKLYYDAPAALEVEALLRTQREAGDGRWAVVLDRTLIFPGGGGQPADAGWIDGAPVVAMGFQGEEIVHYLAEPLPAKDPLSRVKVRLDGERRRESAQQHTGQHIVSACLLRGGGFQTVSVHMGELTMTVESPVPSIPEEQIHAAERCANEVICRNLPVRSHLVSGDELERFNLRRAPAERELYRVVEIEGHDASACGGVHVSRTGEVGLVKWVGTEKIRGNCRTSWLVGDRAYRDYARKTELLRELGAELSAPAEEIGGAVRRLKDELAALAARAEALELRFAASEAERLLAGTAAGGLRVVVRRYEGAGRAFLRALGTELAGRGGTVALLASVEEGQADLLACRSPDVRVELGEALKPHLGMVGGKGGGREGTWQGMARETARLDEFLEAASRAMRGTG